MADIFISYSREDREWVSKLADALQAEGFTVWWDWDLLVGKRYRETIETELQTCKATVVVWSQHSVRSDFVRDEAEEGQQRNILVPILKESVRPPAGFRQLQTADFSTWTGGTAHAEYQRMIKGLSHLIGRPGASATDHVDAAPAPVTAPEPVQPAPVAQPAPAPIVPPAAAAVAPVVQPMPAAAVQAKAPEPPVHTPVVTPAPPAKHGMPVIGYIAIGVVALIAVLAIAVALFPNNTPPVKPLTPSHPTTVPVDGSSPTTPAHPTNPTTPPVTTPPGEPADEAGNSHGGSSSGGGHHGSSGGTPPAPPQPPAGDSGDQGQDVGQSH